MDRAFPARLAVATLTFVVLVPGLGAPAAAAAPARPSRLTTDERAELLQYANDTWRVVRADDVAERAAGRQSDP